MTKMVLVVDDISKYEAEKLYIESQALFDEVKVIDNFSNILICLEKDKPHEIYLGNTRLYDDNSDINVALFKSTKHNRVAKSVLAHIFNNIGINIVDPIERFTIGFSSKILSTIDRHNKNCIIDSYFSFSHQSTLELSRRFNTKLFIKPINGSQSRGITTINTLGELINYSESFHYSDESPLFVQKFIEIEKEYRMFVVNGKVIASMKKIRRGNGSVYYRRMRFARLAEFVINHVSDVGVLGVDACKDIYGNFYIIEANRSPMFKALERTTNRNIAREILTNL